MPTYKAPVDDVMLLLNDVFHIERYNNLPGFADAPPDLLEAVLGEAAKFCEGVLTPLIASAEQGRLSSPRRRQRDHAHRIQRCLQTAD